MASVSNISGIVTPILKPMHADMSLNFEEFTNQVEMKRKAANGIFCFGTNGES